DRGRKPSGVPRGRRHRPSGRAGRHTGAGRGARRRAGRSGGRGADGARGARAGGVGVVLGRERQGDRGPLRDDHPGRRVIPALAVAAVALAIRLLVAEFLPLIDHDGIVYVTIAKQVHASGTPFDPLYHPLYPLCIALAEPLVGDRETTGRRVFPPFGAPPIRPPIAPPPEPA